MLWYWGLKVAPPPNACRLLSFWILSFYTIRLSPLATVSVFVSGTILFLQFCYGLGNKIIRCIWLMGKIRWGTEGSDVDKVQKRQQGLKFLHLLTGALLYVGGGATARIAEVPTGMPHASALWGTACWRPCRVTEWPAHCPVGLERACRTKHWTREDVKNNKMRTTSWESGCHSHSSE